MPIFKRLILSAIAHWESLTCMTFVPYYPGLLSQTHKGILQFAFVTDGCYSDVGYPDTSLNITVANINMSITNVFIGTGCIVNVLLYIFVYSMPLEN